MTSKDALAKTILIGLSNEKKKKTAASHMGGLWERQIRSVRSILSALM